MQKIVKVHRVFPSNYEQIPYLHGNSNFAKIVMETAEKSLCHSCATELTSQGISLP